MVNITKIVLKQSNGNQPYFPLSLRLLHTFAGVLQKKIRTRAVFKNYKIYIKKVIHKKGYT